MTDLYDLSPPFFLGAALLFILVSDDLRTALWTVELLLQDRWSCFLTSSSITPLLAVELPSCNLNLNMSNRWRFVILHPVIDLVLLRSCEDHYLLPRVRSGLNAWVTFLNYPNSATCRTVTGFYKICSQQIYIISFVSILSFNLSHCQFYPIDDILWKN